MIFRGAELQVLNSLFLFFPLKKKKPQLNSSHSINRVHYNIGKHGKYLRFWHSLSQGPLCAVCQFFFFFLELVAANLETDWTTNVTQSSNIQLFLDAMLNALHQILIKTKKGNKMLYVLLLSNENIRNKPVVKSTLDQVRQHRFTFIRRTNEVGL